MLTDGTLSLRVPTEADADATANAVRSSLPELERWMPWANSNYGPDDALDWMNGTFDATAHSFLIIDDDHQVIGSCGLNHIDALNRRANLGYWVRTDRTGLGVATRATVLLARHALADLDLHRLEILMSVHNEASKRVAERAGATYEGIQHKRLRLHDVFHDAHMFSIVSTS